MSWQEDRRRPVLVAACGNAAAGDDAFGPRVAERLRECRPPHVEVVDLGMKPAGLLDLLEDRVGLIVVDAAAPAEPSRRGELIDVEAVEGTIPNLVHDEALSSHGLSISHELALAKKLGWLPPHVRVIAAEAASTRVGEAMSEATAAVVEPAVRRIVELTNSWSAELRPAAPMDA